MQEITKFLDILKALHEGGVRFVVIGGVAMRLHGAAQITDDVDVCYGRSPQDLENLVKTLSAHKVRLRGVPEDLPFIFDLRTLRNILNLTLTTDLGDVDILGEVPGIGSFESLWDRAVEMEVNGMAMRVASIEDLIAMKRAANRPKDQAHLMELEALQRLIQQEGE